MKVLLIEDEPKTLFSLVRGLREKMFAVDFSADGEEGLSLAVSNPYDIVVLDVMLPKRDGWSILSMMRQASVRTPVLFLTAMDRVEDRVRGLELGADDYLIKPFAFSELLARIHSILRRVPARLPDLLSIGDLEVDRPRHRVTRGGVHLELTPKEFTLLFVLASRPGEVISRAEISEKVWDVNFDSFTNVIDVHVRRLRAKLDDPFEKKLIRTVRGIGYALDAG